MNLFNPPLGYSLNRHRKNQSRGLVPLIRIAFLWMELSNLLAATPSSETPWPTTGCLTSIISPRYANILGAIGYRYHIIILLPIALPTLLRPPIRPRPCIYWPPPTPRRGSLIRYPQATVKTYLGANYWVSCGADRRKNAPKSEVRYAIT